MSFIDPTKPVEGEPTTQSVRDNFAAAKSEIEALQSAMDAVAGGGAPYLPLTGGTLTGALRLAGDPISALQAATKQYVDAGLGAYLPLAGGTMTGPIAVTGGTNPLVVTNAAGAVPASYIGGSNFVVFSTAGGNARAVIDAINGNPFFTGRRAGGTAAAPTPVLADQVLAGIQAYGRGTTGYLANARGYFALYAAETFTDTAAGSYIAFSTAPIGSIGGGIERARITDAGVLRVGLTGTSNVVSLTPGLTAADPATLAASGTGGLVLPTLIATNTTAPLVLLSRNGVNPWPGVPTLPNATVTYIAGNGGNVRLVHDAYGGSVFFDGRRATGLYPGTASVLNDTFMAFRAYGSSPAGFSGNERARIAFSAAENFTDTAQGAYISFHTAPIGSAPSVLVSERMRLTDAGALQFAVTGPSLSVGAGAPTASMPSGSVYLRNDGGVGTRIYIGQGGTSWLPVAGV